eukprot:787083-Amphidinium_carterae.1
MDRGLLPVRCRHWLKGTLMYTSWLFIPSSLSCLACFTSSELSKVQYTSSMYSSSCSTALAAF